MGTYSSFHQEALNFVENINLFVIYKIDCGPKNKNFDLDSTYYKEIINYVCIVFFEYNDAKVTFLW